MTNGDYLLFRDCQSTYQRTPRTWTLFHRPLTMSWFFCLDDRVYDLSDPNGAVRPEELECPTTNVITTRYRCKVSLILVFFSLKYLTQVDHKDTPSIIITGRQMNRRVFSMNHKYNNNR